MPFDTTALSNPRIIEPTNPLAAASQAVQFGGALLGNKIRQAEFDAQKAQGAAYAHHYNALTGKYDMPAVQAEMGASEAGQLGLPDAVTRVRSQQSQEINNDTQQLQVNSKRMGMIAGLFAPYLQKPDLTKSDLVPAYGTAIAHGLMSIDQANQSYASLAEGGDALKQQARGALDGAAGAEHSYQDAYGTTQLVDDGGVLRWQNVSSPASGQGGRDVGAPIAKQTSPDFNQTYTDRTIMTPNGPMRVPMTNAQFQAYQGVQGSFTGRRIDTAGGTSTGAPNVPAGAVPVGAEDQAKTGLNVRNVLASQQPELVNNIATLRNLDSLLSNPALKTVRSRTLRDIGNNASKFIPWGPGDKYATLGQEIDKAGTTLRKQMMDAGGGPHTNAGLADLEHITPGMDMTPTAARALTNEMLTAAIYQQGRHHVAANTQDPSRVMGALADYDQNFDPRFGTIQRLGPEEGREYAKTHIGDPAQYAASVYRMAKASRDKGYDYGMTPQQIDRIISSYEGKRGR